jgi:hypothetical protein
VYVERVLADMHLSGDGWALVALRFGHVCGAHPSGRLGDDATHSQAANLVKEAALVAMGKRPSVALGSNVVLRDYVHVLDVADAFVAAAQKLLELPTRKSNGSVGSWEVFNVGTGVGVSDRAVVDAMAVVSGLTVAHEPSGKEKGDAATCVLNVEKAALGLGWRAARDLAAMCRDAWRWQNAHPTGYVRPLKEFGAFAPATFLKSAMPELSSGRRRSTDNDGAFSKPVSNWERADGSKKFDKPIRGWEKGQRVTKPVFAGKLDGLDSIESLDDADYVEAMGQAF